MDDALLYALARRAQHKAVRSRRRKAGRTPAHRPNTSDMDVALSPAQRRGRDSEDRAGLYLQDCGLVILARNLLAKTGEIDLVARDGAILVFIEVRDRHSRHYGGAAASVNRNKQLRLIRTAQCFLPRLVQRHFPGGMPACRFDVICVEPQGLTWIQDAFRA